jgi:hypothetical protein
MSRPCDRMDDDERNAMSLQIEMSIWRESRETVREH